MKLRSGKSYEYKRYVPKKRNKNRKIATVGTVKRIVGQNVEHKYYDLITARQGFYNDPSMFCLNPITQALGDNGSRVGDTVIAKSLVVKGHIFGDAVGSSCKVRLILFQYYDHPGTVPDETVILQHYATNDQMLNSPFAHDNKSQFQILKDVTFFVVADAATVGQPTKCFKFTAKLKRKKIQYDAAGTNSYNSIWLMAMSDTGILVQQPKIAFTSRLVYTDA